MAYLHVIANLAFFLDSTDNVEKVIDGWKMSNDEANALRWMFDNRQIDGDISFWREQIINGAVRDHVIALLDKRKESNTADLIRKWQIPVFPLSGQDLIDLGLKPGPAFGKILKEMKRDWVASGFKMTKEQMLALVRTYVHD